MEKLPEYFQLIEEGKTLVDNHNKLLESLLLSKQANDNNIYTYEETDEGTDDSFDTSEGISDASYDSFA
jgi:hypothetical protein